MSNLQVSPCVYDPILLFNDAFFCKKETLTIYPSDTKVFKVNIMNDKSLSCYRIFFSIIIYDKNIKLPVFGRAAFSRSAV